MNQDEAVDYWMTLRQAQEAVKRCIRLADGARVAPTATLRTVLEMLVVCEEAAHATLKKHDHEMEFEV